MCRPIKRFVSVCWYSILSAVKIFCYITKSTQPHIRSVPRGRESDCRKQALYTLLINAIRISGVLRTLPICALIPGSCLKTVWIAGLLVSHVKCLEIRKKKCLPWGFTDTFAFTRFWSPQRCRWRSKSSGMWRCVRTSTIRFEGLCCLQRQRRTPRSFETSQTTCPRTLRHLTEVLNVQICFCFVGNKNHNMSES
jgi:hypothetical protein